MMIPDRNRFLYAVVLQVVGPSIGHLCLRRKLLIVRVAGQMDMRLKLMVNWTVGELRKHTLGLWLISLYAVIAVLSWSITCVLCYQPVGIPTYFDQVGNYSRSQYDTSDGWRKVATIGNSVIAAVSIPITSAICAKAAAVYCQRISTAKAPPLTLRQMLVLADQGWSDSGVIWDVFRPSTSRRTRSPLLIFASVLVAIGKRRAHNDSYSTTTIG